MTIPSLTELAISAFAAVVGWFWWTRRQEARRADSAERRAEAAEAERDAAKGEAVGAVRHAELTDNQRQADAAGEDAAKEIRHAPTSPDPVASVRAIDAAARGLSDADRARPDGGDRRAPTVPPRR